MNVENSLTVEIYPLLGWSISNLNKLKTTEFLDSGRVKSEKKLDMVTAK